MSELEIPEAARHAATEALLDTHDPIDFAATTVDAVIEAAAPIIVAAAYRKLAGNCPCGICDRLRCDADELDPEGWT